MLKNVCGVSDVGQKGLDKRGDKMESRYMDTCSVGLVLVQGETMDLPGTF